MATDRLSPLDASFLAVERPTAHMHVGWVAYFDPPEAGPRPGFDRLPTHIPTRLGAGRRRGRSAARRGAPGAGRLPSRPAGAGVGGRPRLRPARAHPRGAPRNARTRGGG